MCKHNFEGNLGGLVDWNEPVEYRAAWIGFVSKLC